MPQEGNDTERATLHDFVVEYVKVLAEVFGWRITTASGSKRGPDVVIEHVFGNKVDAVLLVESEVGHDLGSASDYFEKLCRRHSNLIRNYRNKGVEHIGIVIIANAPRRLSNYLKEHGKELCECLNLSRNNKCILKEGFNIFIVPVAIFKEVMPAVLIGFMGTPG